VSRVCLLFAFVLAALPAQAETLRELEQAQQRANKEWTRIQAKVQRREKDLDGLQRARALQSQRVAQLQKDVADASWISRSLYQSRLEQARQELRSLSNEVARLTSELEQNKKVEQARRLRLIGAIRAHTDRLFAVAERALALKPPREEQANAMVEKAIADLPLLEDLERSKWVKHEAPTLVRFADETRGKSLKELDELANFYNELSDEAQREQRNLLPEHTRLTKRLQRLNRLAQLGIADKRLPVLIQRTRDALGRADDVLSSFKASAESHKARARQIETLIASRSLEQGRAPGGGR